MREDVKAHPMIPIARPWMGEAEAEAARRVILSGWLTQGPEVAAFEQEFAADVGAPHACAVSNCTSALHLALLALGVGRGDEVIVPSHSFIATANAVRHCGAVPTFVDIDPATYNVDPRLVEQAIGPRTRAILCVHQLGMPCDLRAIVDIGRRRGIVVVEDAACAAGSSIRWDGAWEPIGKPRGDVACFSFHPRKLLSTGDGGMITTADARLDHQFRILRHQGMDTSDVVRHTATRVTFEQYPVVGYNYRLTDVQAAIGREQLRRLPEMIARRRQLAARYRSLFADCPDVVQPFEPEWARSNWQSYCVRLPTGCDQRRVMQQMLDAGVATRRGVMCAHREPPYLNGRLSGAASGLGASERAQDECLLLPLFHELTDEDQTRVAEALRSACAITTRVP